MEQMQLMVLAMGLVRRESLMPSEQLEKQQT